MASELRAKGQEVTVRIMRDDDLVTELTSFRDLNIVFRVRVIEEAYLGETTLRKDDLWEGVRGTMTAALEGDSGLELINAVRDRAQRRNQSDDPAFSILARIAFPDGTTPRLVFTDVRFDEIPLNVPGRDQYVTMALSWQADDYDII